MDKNCNITELQLSSSKVQWSFKESFIMLLFFILLLYSIISFLNQWSKNYRGINHLPYYATYLHSGNAIDNGKFVFFQFESLESYKKIINYNILSLNLKSRLVFYLHGKIYFRLHYSPIALEWRRVWNISRRKNNKNCQGEGKSTINMMILLCPTLPLQEMKKVHSDYLIILDTM